MIEIRKELTSTNEHDLKHSLDHCSLSLFYTRKTNKSVSDIKKKKKKQQKYHIIYRHIYNGIKSSIIYINEMQH